MSRRWSRKKVDLPDAGDPTKRMISGDDDGGMTGIESGFEPVEDGILFMLVEVVWRVLFEGAVDRGM